MKIKVGVIGVGAMGQHHARVYSELPDVELVGVADVDGNLARSIAERFHTKAFTDYKKLLKQGLDAVSIAVPTSLHKEVAVDVAEAGVSMLVEKPIADTVANAEEIVRRAERNRVRLMIGHIERFNPIIPVMKRSIENSDVISIGITRVGPITPRIRDVGVVIDLATHDIDLIRYLANSEFKKIYGLTSRSLSEREDIAILSFEMANGVLAHITTNWLTPYKVREINIYTKTKFIKGSLIDQKVSEFSNYGEDNGYLVRELNIPYGEPLRLELESFMQSINKGSEPPVSGQDGLRALEIALKCLTRKGMKMVESTTPMVSIIVPTSNSARTIEATLQSIKCQTYPTIEAIVVDNYSTDNTTEIAQKYGAKVYQVGPERASQDNYGVEQANGEFVFITGSDMIIDQDYIEQAVKKCIGEGYDAIYASVLTVGDGFWAKVKGLERLTYIGDDFFESARFFRRKVFLDLGGYDESLVLNADDYDMQHRLDMAGYRTGRITAVERHTDEPTSLRQLAQKSYYYAKFAKSYVRKYPAHATKQLFPIRLPFIRHIDVLLKDPVHFVGLIAFKVVQYSAAFCGFVVSLISKDQLDQRMHQRIYGDRAEDENLRDEQEKDS